jgi:uncharacterized protein
MKYYDKIYGAFDIDEPVLLELIESPALQRLKDVDQGGYAPLFEKPLQEEKIEHSRYSHSLGVFLLLNRYRASLEEQISGLIHDVSHSAFSHCIDYILDVDTQEEQNHQDNLFESYVHQTTIPSILAKHGFNLDYILDDSHFPLKETNLPDLCADRIDYTLRGAFSFHEIDQEDISYLLQHLKVENNTWVFDDFESGKKFSDLFFHMNKNFWSGFSTAVMFQAVADCMRHSLNQGFITHEDLYTTDTMVLEKIKKKLPECAKLQTFWKRMNDKTLAFFDPHHFHGKVVCKSRVVDPICNHKGLKKRISEIDSSYKDLIAHEAKPKQHFVSFSKE